jgi:hypothetical protein
VVDISSCRAERSAWSTNSPAQFFTPSGYGSNPFIPGYDWDGDFLFLFNTFIRNQGWGDLYEYNMELRKANTINPIDDRCCYRDPLWSPDKTYVFLRSRISTLDSKPKPSSFTSPMLRLAPAQPTNPCPCPKLFTTTPAKRPNPPCALYSLKKHALPTCPALHAR